MRRLPAGLTALFFVPVLISCGDGTEPPNPGDPDSGPIDSPSPPRDSSPIDAPPDARPCPAFSGTWALEVARFNRDVTAATTLDFSFRGDGTSRPADGTQVPTGEYVACCGLRVEPASTDPSARVIWSGNNQAGFSIRTTCNGGACSGNAGIKLTFTTPYTAVGANYAGSTTMTVYNLNGGTVATLGVQGSGTNFLGHMANTKLGGAQLIDDGTEEIRSLRYFRCQ
jgi:hypothetical protein